MSFLIFFPLDNVPDNDKANRRMKFQFYYHFALRRKVENYKSNRWYINFLYALGAVHDIPTLLQKRHDVMVSCDDDTSRRLIAMPSARQDYDDSYLLREQMDPPIDLDFCGHKFMAPKDTQVQLEMLFGDYMELPPPESRLGHRLRRFEIDEYFWKDILEQFLPQVGSSGKF